MTFKYMRFLMWINLVVIIQVCAWNSIAHATFGQSDVPLIEYYNHGKEQTGVAAFTAHKGIYEAIGTANLVDVGIHNLEGRLLITAAHVIDGIEDIASSALRFTDTNNDSISMGVKSLHFSKDYKKEKKDVGFIVLSERVDTQRFKPLKLNLTKDNKALVGSEISVIGCSGCMGHIGSHLVAEEPMKSPLRRGMQTLLQYGDNSTARMIYSFYHRPGFIKIWREPEFDLTEQGRARKEEVEIAMETLKSKAEKNKALGIKDPELMDQYMALLCESFPQKMTRQSFSQKILCDEPLEIQLNNFVDVDDLDKVALVKAWDQLSVVGQKKDVEHGSLTLKNFNLGKYIIHMRGPLPRLSGFIYGGDSGGAWIIGDEIVAISSTMAGAAATAEGGYENFNSLEFLRVTSDALKSLNEYFSCYENVLKNRSLQHNSLLKEDDVAATGTSVWSCKDLLESMLKEILAGLK